MRIDSTVKMVFILILVGLLLRNYLGFGQIVGAIGPQLTNFIRALSGTTGFTSTGQATVGAIGYAS